MAGRTIGGLQARRMATYGLTAGIVLSVGAVSLWALQIPGMGVMPEKPAPLPPPAPPEAQAKTAPRVDAETVSAMGERFDLAVVKAPVIAAKEEAKEPEPAPGPEWTYLGPIHEATRNLAIISVDGVQKILCEGRSFGDTKLVSVADDKITVEVKGVPSTIERGQRDYSKSVAWVRNIQNAAPPPGVGQPVVATQAGGRGGLPPEVQARLAQRGMTPEQIQNFRQGRGGDGRNNNNNNGGGGGGRGGRGNFGGGNGATFTAPVGDGRQRAVPVSPNMDTALDADSTRRAIN